MCKDLGLQSELADSLAIGAGLRGRSGRGQLDVVNTKIVQSTSDFYLLFSREESGCELFSLPKCTLNDLEATDVAQEIADRLATS